MLREALHLSLSCFPDVPGLAMTRWLFAEGAGGISAARTHKALEDRLDQKDSSRQARSSPSPASKAASWQDASPDPAPSRLRDLCLLAIWENRVWVIIYVGTEEG